MRVTQQTMVRQALLRLETRNENLDRLTSAVASGKEVLNPSDSPERYSRSARMKETLQQNEQYSKTIRNSLAWLQTTETALNSLNDLTLEARDIAFKAADATTDDSLLDSLAERVEGILEEVLDVSNSEYLGKSIFSGSDTDESEPFRMVNGQVAYFGNSAGLQRRIGASVKIQINISGSELQSTGLAEELVNLRDALQNRDRASISAAIDTLKTSSESMLSLAASVGSRQTTLSAMESRIEQINLNLSAFVSEAEDVDLAEAIVKLESEQNAYTAALRTTADISQLNIMQFFR